MDNLSDHLEKLRIFLSDEKVSYSDDEDQHPVGSVLDLVRVVLEDLKQNKGIYLFKTIIILLP